MSETDQNVTPAQEPTTSGEGQNGQVQGQGAAPSGESATPPAGQQDQGQAQEGQPGQSGQGTTEQPKTGEGTPGGKPDGQKQEGATPPADVTLVLPEGTQPTPMTKWFEATAKEHGLSQEQAQAVYAAYSKLEGEAAKAKEADALKAASLLQGEWQRDFKPNLALAQKTVRELGTPALLEHLDRTGLGSHPEMVRLMYRVGKLLSDDSFRVGSTVPGDTGAANVMYPNQGK